MVLGYQPKVYCDSVRPSVAIINFRTGNLFSVYSAVKRANNGEIVTITDDPKVINSSDRIILPGQGNADSCLRLLSHNTNLKRSLLNCLRLKPVLGICVGQHLLSLRSEESIADCLGCFSCVVKRLRSPNEVPHIGWSAVWYDKSHPILNNIPMPAAFYFSHSYYVSPPRGCDGAFTFCGRDVVLAMLMRDNIVTTQFHPEKSSHFGSAVLHNFLRWKP